MVEARDGKINFQFFIHTNFQLQFALLMNKMLKKKKTAG